MNDVSTATLQSRVMQAEQERDQARAELADCQRQAAATREALAYLRAAIDADVKCFGLMPSRYAVGISLAEAALKADAGRGWVRLNWRPGTEPFDLGRKVIVKTHGHIATYAYPQADEQWIYADELLEDGK